MHAIVGAIHAYIVCDSRNHRFQFTCYGRGNPSPTKGDMPLTGRGLKHLIHRKRSPFSFSGDANPFVLADISPNRGIASRGRQEWGKWCPCPKGKARGGAFTTIVVCGRGVVHHGVVERYARRARYVLTNAICPDGRGNDAVITRGRHYRIIFRRVSRFGGDTFWKTV